MSYRILTIDPGSTSTKIGVFDDEKMLFEENLHHSAEELAQFETIPQQEAFRAAFSSLSTAVLTSPPTP